MLHWCARPRARVIGRADGKLAGRRDHGQDDDPSFPATTGQDTASAVGQTVMIPRLQVRQ
jgi:hypothetical protein